MKLTRSLVFCHDERRVAYPVGTRVSQIAGDDEESLYCQARARGMNRRGADMIACVIDGRARIIEKRDAR